VVVLLAGELVTNAVTHTPVTTAGIGLLVLLGEDGVRVEVHDRSPELPEQAGPGWEDESGRGLGLVATQATRWGVQADAHGHGKAVWFEVHT
jgi:anti-sigma regulatory factor (Ser/Thr protein kinase)